jgi:hypothetical protein
MKKLRATVVMGQLLLTLSGCASGVVSMGKDTYMVARKGSSWSTATSLKAKCLKDANEYCERRGLVMVPVSFAGRDGGIGVMGSCEVVFRAVSPTDAENVRPNMRPDANQIIEQR